MHPRTPPRAALPTAPWCACSTSAAATNATPRSTRRAPGVVNGLGVVAQAGPWRHECQRGHQPGADGHGRGADVLRLRRAGRGGGRLTASTSNLKKSLAAFVCSDPFMGDQQVLPGFASRGLGMVCIEAFLQPASAKGPLGTAPHKKRLHVLERGSQKNCLTVPGLRHQRAPSGTDKDASSALPATPRMPARTSASEHSRSPVARLSGNVNGQRGVRVGPGVVHAGRTSTPYGSSPCANA